MEVKEHLPVDQHVYELKESIVIYDSVKASMRLKQNQYICPRATRLIMQMLTTFYKILQPLAHILFASKHFYVTSVNWWKDLNSAFITKV